MEGAEEKRNPYTAFFQSRTNIIFTAVTVVLVVALVCYMLLYYRDKNYYSLYQTDQQTITSQQGSISDDQNIIASSKAQIAKLNQQVSSLNTQLAAAQTQAQTSQQPDVTQPQTQTQDTTTQAPSDSPANYLQVKVTSFTGPDSAGMWEIKFTLTNTSNQDISDIWYRYTLQSNGQNVTSDDDVEYGIAAGQSKEEDAMIQWDTSPVDHCYVQIEKASWGGQ